MATGVGAVTEQPTPVGHLADILATFQRPPRPWPPMESITVGSPADGLALKRAIREAGPGGVLRMNSATLRDVREACHEPDPHPWASASLGDFAGVRVVVDEDVPDRVVKIEQGGQVTAMETAR
jgi:hypothetical protein